MKHTDHNSKDNCLSNSQMVDKIRWWLCYVLLTVFSTSLFADNRAITLIYQDDKDFAVEIARSIAVKLKQADFSTSLTPYHSITKKLIDDLPEDTLIVTLGGEASDLIVHEDIPNPVLSLLVTRHAYETLKKNNGNKKNWATLILDQPYERQLLMIKHLLGRNATTGILLGSHSLDEKPLLLEAANKHKQNVIIDQINITDQLISSIKKLINKSDVILAIPDPVAFNRNTIRGILLLTYRKNIPLIGFSSSYVKAGAVAALHSEPDQIIKQANKIITEFMQTGVFKHSYYYPDDFSISINNKVAYTLGIPADKSDSVKDKILSEELDQ